MKKINLLFLISILFSVALFGFLLTGKARADYSDNVYGYAWSENIGWISFNCTDTDWCATSSYGVNIDKDTGYFSGEAWSENIGWITFNWASTTGEAPPGGYDYSGEGYLAKLVSTTTPPEVRGWARACGIDGGALQCGGDGWDGWIKLRGTLEASTTEYGVSVATTPPPKEFSGWAWGGDDTSTEAVVGWISFNVKNCDVDGDGTYEGASEGGGATPAPAGCPTSGTAYDYKVLTSIDFPPFATSTKLNAGSPWYCGVGPGKGLVGFQWTYQDPDGDDQSAYWLRVATDSGFNNLVVDATASQSVVPGGTGSAGVSIVPSPTAATDDFDIGYNDTYYWRVMVQDTADNWALDWADGPSFSVKPHAYPWPQFDYSPSHPTVNEVVTTANNSICYTAANNATSCVSWLWTVNGASTPDGTWDFATGTATSKEPEFIFFNHTSYNVALKATDSDGNSCSSPNKTISVRLPLPEWREIAPTGLLREFLTNIAKMFRI